MIVVFYSVNNPKDFDRYTFSTCEPKEALRQLISLPVGHYRLYNLNKPNDLYLFQCDYNDEILDGGWWCMMFDMTTEEYDKLVYEWTH